MRTVSLELTKQLKEAGYLQPNHEFWWVQEDPDSEYELEHDGNIAIESYRSESAIVSPTADEILDQLPRTINLHKNELWINIWNLYDKWVDCWHVGYGLGQSKGGMIRIESQADSRETLANAAAKMWLYLKKEGLLHSSKTEGTEKV